MKFLVAVDRGPDADRVLSFALDIAEGVGASVTAVHAVDPDVNELLESEPITTLSDASQRLVTEHLESAEARGTTVLESAERSAADRDATIQTELVYGDPVPAITDYAAEAGFDAIFVGHQGRSPRTEAVVGSVAKGIVARASVPVTVVR